MKFDKAMIQLKLDGLPILEAKMSLPENLSNQKKYKELLREYSTLQRLEKAATRYLGLQTQLQEAEAMLADTTTDSELRQLAESDLQSARAEIPDVELALMTALAPADPKDARNVIMEIRAGTGGAEAALFAGDLFRMYSRYLDKKGMKVSVVESSLSDVGGFKEIVLTVDGDGAYGLLKLESGGHRVQRVPETEGAGRIHTSAATVVVFPEADAEDDIQIPADEIRIDVFCSSGAGGQSVNTTYSAIRVTHIPTGTVAQSQDERSQQRNKEKALQVLKARMLEARRIKEEQTMGNTRRSLMGTGDRNARIRTYNFPQNRLTDHRIGLTLYRLEQLVEGDLDDLIGPLRAYDAQMRIDEQLGNAIIPLAPISDPD
jgi:peptide chain release factor 1